VGTVLSTLAAPTIARRTAAQTFSRSAATTALDGPASALAVVLLTIFGTVDFG